MQVCTKCKLPKDESEFYKKGQSLDCWCKACKRADAKRWREENPEKYRQQLKSWKQRNPNRPKEWRDSTGYHRLRKFGLTKDEWESLFDKQGRCCAICRTTSPASKNGHWHTDHDHKTGKVRGILCGNCNLGLGNLQDSIDVLRAAIHYLESVLHEGQPIAENQIPDWAGKILQTAA